MPSFDVVSELDFNEVTNAVDQAMREVSTRYDFKGSKAKVEKVEKTLVLTADSDFQLEQLRDIVYQKLARRKVDIRAVEEGKVEPASGDTVRQTLLLKTGIGADLAKKIVRLVKDSKLKVQAAIQGDQVRVSGKKRDDLQQVIALLRAADIEQPLQFENFRD